MTTTPLPSITDDILAEIEAEFRACHASHRDISIEPDQAVALVERLREAEMDAARYRKLRTKLTGATYNPRFFEDLYLAGCFDHPSDVDSEIDTAMQDAACR